jgi:hypothetical protein
MISNKLVCPPKTKKAFLHKWVGLRKEAQPNCVGRAMRAIFPNIIALTPERYCH